MLCIMKKYGIKVVCIFDGPNPPPEKAVEQERRRAETKKAIHRMKECQRVRDIITNDIIPNDETMSEELKNDHET